MPGAPALVIQPRAQNLRDRLEIFSVLDGVFNHRRRERPPRPVRLLAALVQRDAAELLDQRAVAEGLESEQLRGEHGVKNGLRLGRPGAAEHAQIEIRAMKDPGVAAGRRPEFVQGKRAERIDEKMAAVVRDLDQADAFPIVVQAVGLGVEGDGKIAAQIIDEGVERGRRVDPEKLDFALRHRKQEVIMRLSAGVASEIGSVLMQ